MIPRKVHFSRLLDIISGSALAGANTKVQKSALYKDFDLAKLETKKLRALIDSNLPTFYIVDINLTVEEVGNGIGLNTFKENEEYTKLNFPSKADLKTFLKNTLTESIKKLPQKSFVSSTYDPLEKEYNKLLDKLAKRTSYIGYRNAATVFGFELRKILKSSGVYIASDGESIVSGLGSDKYVVIGPSFNSAVEKVNSLFNDSLRKAFSETYGITLKGYSDDPNNRFTIGDFINAGHTAAYTQEGKLIGVNAPFAQEKQFVLSGTDKAQGIDAAIATLYLDANYDIKFQQNFSQNATNLLNMQFSFVVTMPSKFNTATLRTNELRRIKEYIGKTVLPTVQEQALKKFTGGILESVVTNSSASPTLLEYIESAISGALLNKKPVNIVKTSSRNKKTEIKSHAVLAGSNKVSIKAKSGGLKLKQQNFKSKPITTTSLASLQRLLDAQLVQQVKQNMGGGSRRDILNLRTGRFAESVKVERLSESREGMITAFYSYMRNPYATFSAGGRQETPKTRDPKLLIAKSIREVAAQLVTNRLRSVNV